MEPEESGAWKRIEPTLTQKVWYRTLVEKMFVLPDGKQKSFTTIGNEGDKAAGCIAITREGKVIVAKQFRPGPEKMMYEIPGGGVEQGEDPQVAALRELREETAYVPGSVHFLGSTCRDAYINCMWYYYLVTDCVPSGDAQALDDSEHVEVCLISIDELLHNARHDLMTDPAAVLLAYEELMKLRSSHDRDETN